jgi:hypothetical protein
MNKNILNEIKSMQYLSGYKRGVVISEQQQQIDLNALINPNSQNNVYGGYNELQNLLKQNPDLQKAINSLGAIATGTPATGTPATGTPTTGTPTTGAPATGTPTTETPQVTQIKMGVKNPSIEELQKFLNTNYKSNLVPDGKYGPKTSASILLALQNKMKSTEQEQTSSPENTSASTAAEKTAAANTSQEISPNTKNNQQITQVQGQGQQGQGQQGQGQQGQGQQGQGQGIKFSTSTVSDDEIA